MLYLNFYQKSCKKIDGSGLLSNIEVMSNITNALKTATFNIPETFRELLTTLLMKINNDDKEFKIYADFRLKFVAGEATSKDMEVVWKIIPYELEEKFRRMFWYYTADPAFSPEFYRNAIEAGTPDVAKFLVEQRGFPEPGIVA